MTSRNNTAPRNAGFTLLEMLVVIAVMGVALLLLTGYRQPHSRAIETDAAARQVAQAMRDARGQAVTQGHPVALTLPHLPPWLAVAMQAPKGGIVFMPDGSASGGSVILGAIPHDGFEAKNAAKIVTVRADWLTGRVQIDAP